MFSLESPYQGDSNTQYTIFKINTKITRNHPNPAAIVFFPKGVKQVISVRAIEVLEKIRGIYV